MEPWHSQELSTYPYSGPDRSSKEPPLYLSSIGDKQAWHEIIYSRHNIPQHRVGKNSSYDGEEMVT
jgi:hypothetical protein